MSSEASSSTLSPCSSSQSSYTEIAGSQSPLKPATRFAEVFLGHEYYKVLHQPLRPERVLQKLPNNISAEEEPLQEATAFENNSSNVIELLQEQFPLSYDFEFSDLTEQMDPPSIENGLCFASALIKPIKCSYKITPPLCLGVVPTPVSVVKEGWVYTGFKVLGVVQLSTQFTCEPAFSQCRFSCEQLQNTLAGRSIQSVTIYAKGFGNFIVCRHKKFADWTEIDNFMAEMRETFLQKASSILPREFALHQETSLARLDSFPISPQSTPKEIAEDQQINLHILANKIRLFHSASSDPLKPKLPLYFHSYLSRVYSIFEPIISVEDNVNPSSFSYTVVSNAPDAYGKSLLIGRQLAADIVPQQTNRNWCKNYLDYTHFSEYYPWLNHSKKPISGYSISQKYIEFRRYRDTVEFSANIARLADYMATELFSPHRLILLLNEPPIHNGNMGLAPQFVQLLNKHLQSPHDPSVLSSVLFVINNNALTEEDSDVMSDMSIAIEKVRWDIRSHFSRYLTQEKLPPILRDQIPEILRDLAAKLLSLPCEFHDANEIDAARMAFVDSLVAVYKTYEQNKQNYISKHVQTLSILEQLKPKNFLFADFMDANFRHLIDEWESDTGTLTAESFRTNDIMQEHLPELTNALHATVSYFNSLYRKKETHLSELYEYREFCRFIDLLTEKLKMTGEVFSEFHAHVNEKLPEISSQSSCILA